MAGKNRNNAKAAYYGKAKFNRKPGGLIKNFDAAKAYEKKLGKLGPASKCRSIDPATVDCSAYLERVQNIKEMGK
mgnify:CR=1 FL=1